MRSFFPFRAASIQFNPKLKQREENIQSLYRLVEQAAEQGAKLIVTPEMATTGYHFADRADITPYVDTIPGSTTDHFSYLARKYDCYVVIGMPEADPETGMFYNAAALIGPEGYVGKYRKCHLWETEERWSAWGDLGFPVFATKIGNVAINICMDSIYFESARIPAIEGADILAFLTNSTAQSISLLQDRAETNGLFIVSANRSNTEQGYHMVGASAIWSPFGEKLAEAPYVAGPDPDLEEPVVLFAQIDPAQFDNPAKRRLSARRPALYQELMLYVAPWDSQKSPASCDIHAAILQYEPEPENPWINMSKADRMIRQVKENSHQAGRQVQLIVLPETSFLGPTEWYSPAEMEKWAESREDSTFQLIRRMAIENQVAIAYGWIEKDKGNLYNAVSLVDAKGRLAGVYRKTHLSEAEQNWASAGEEIPVFTTEFGRMGIMIGYDACFPEVMGILAVKRADLILLPSCWKGEYGQSMELQDRLSVHPYPAGAQSHWNAIAMGAQAYTLVSNFAGPACGCKGGSGIYSLDPLYGLDQVRIAGEDQEEAVMVSFTTNPSHWWFNQEKLILSRRTHLYKSLISSKAMLKNINPSSEQVI